MENRKHKIKELLENFGSLRRHMTFHSADSGEMPRITPSQWGALMMIEQHGESALKDVAKALGITSSATTQLIDGLVISGYVVRKIHDKDRRAVILTLSKKTKTQVEKMKKQVQQKFLKFFEVLDDKELDQYIMFNKKIINRLLKQKTIDI